ncbi:hypothetical protein [Tautonia plasticadhaerens]|uniref:Uncharacterized protein n=1 Tax=Tautonia plasticadhaerens TaxID=2527974 RepID=A0A518H688_9BACT|nr:hypothetical protein [Tautonia plasticadhaerens]QDV36351.1 hypothetical protein ElP_42710 [Tautonia plasticadhaerens]
MARKSAKPLPIEDEEISQEIPEEQEEPEATEPVDDEDDELGTGGDAPNKSQAARAALDAGYEKPGEAVDYIKRSFGIDMNPQHFSAVKSQMKKKEGEGRAAKQAAPARRGRKPKIEPENGDPAPPPRNEATGEGDLLDTLEALKPLIAQYGADKLKRMVDLLG